jgi:hypothetical protein
MTKYNVKFTFEGEDEIQIEADSFVRAISEANRRLRDKENGYEEYTITEIVVLRGQEYENN